MEDKRKQSNPELVAFGARVRLIRESRNLTPRQLADLVGRTKTFICYLENGERGYSWETLSGIATALGVSKAVLLGEEEEPQQDSTPVPETQNMAV